MSQPHYRKWLHFILEFFCIASLIAIWPRYIEPRLLKIKRLKIELPIKKSLKIVQVSDLHLNSLVPKSFIKKLIQKINAEQPDLIFWTGDFLCNGEWLDEARLKEVLTSVKSHYGSYAILGNHDYEKAVFINEEGNYDLVDAPLPSPLLRGLNRIFKPFTLTKKVTERAKKVKPHSKLVHLLKELNIPLLNNATYQVDDLVNVTGLAEYMTGQTNPRLAFTHYNPTLPGIILVHNPDAIPLLTPHPGHLILCGHTHGGQVNLPFIWKRLTALENQKYKQGLFFEQGKVAYVSTGLGGILPFRLNAMPEIVSIELVKNNI